LATCVRALPDTVRHWVPSIDFQNLNTLSGARSVR
jgi:hypothetical protein